MGWRYDAIYAFLNELVRALLFEQLENDRFAGIRSDPVAHLMK